MAFINTVASPFTTKPDAISGVLGGAACAASFAFITVILFAL